MGTSRSLAILAAVVAAATSAPGQSDDAGRYRTRGDSYRNDSGSGSSSGSSSSSRGGSSSAAAASAIVNNVPGANSSGFSGNLGSTANTASGRTGAAAGGLQSVTGTGRTGGGTGAGAARPGAAAPGGAPATNGVNASNLGAPGAKGAGGPPKAGGGALFGMAGQIKVVSKGFAESTKTRKVDYDPAAAAKAPGTIVLNARKYVSPDDGEAAVGTDNRKAGLVQPL